MKDFIWFFFRYFFKIVLFLSLAGCTEKKTDDPIKTGQSPTKEVKPLHGKYWESANYSKEYKMWLEVKAPQPWIIKYILENKLIECQPCSTIPDEAPIWFKPDKNCKQLIRAEDNFESMYFYDTVKSKMFIYETQL
jgi:hypothetical protein